VPGYSRGRELAIADRDIITRQIRDAVDIVGLVGDYVTLRRAGANFKGLCPFHEEKTPSFNVHPAKQIFKCFGCGAGGDVFSFVQMKENVEFVEARRMLAERAGISLEHDESALAGGPRKTDLARANDWAKRVFSNNYHGSVGEAARKYVADRGISREMAQAFGLGLAVDSFDSLIRQAGAARMDVKLLVAAGLAKESARGGYYDTFRHRLMFPIADVTGRILGFGGRTLGEDPAKYLNTPATALFDKSSHLFGLDRAREGISEKGRAVVVEGYTDCIMAHQFGFTETVATLGTAMTEGHARLLRRYTDRVVLLFDSDEAGQRAANRALSVTLTVGLDVALARVPDGKDPCDYLLSGGETAFEWVLNSAVGALEFRWQQVAQEYHASATGPGRRRAIEAYLQELSGWLGRGAIGPIEMGLLLNQLSKVLSVPAEDLHRQLGRMTKRSGGRSSVSPAVNGTSPEGDTAGKGANARQEALRQIMEVLLNEPEHYPAVAGHLDQSVITDPALSAVAGELVRMLESGEPFRLDELIGRLESAAYGRLVTDLQARGERRGGYAAVIKGAGVCLESFERSRETAALADEIRRQREQTADEADGNSAPAGEDERLRALTASAKNPHFSTARARKRFFETSEIRVNGPRDTAKPPPRPDG